MSINGDISAFSSCIPLSNILLEYSFASTFLTCPLFLPLSRYQAVIPAPGDETTERRLRNGTSDRHRERPRPETTEEMEKRLRIRRTRGRVVIGRDGVQRRGSGSHLAAATGVTLWFVPFVGVAVAVAVAEYTSMI